MLQHPHHPPQPHVPLVTILSEIPQADRCELTHVASSTQPTRPARSRPTASSPRLPRSTRRTTLAAARTATAVSSSTRTATRTAAMRAAPAARRSTSTTSKETPNQLHDKKKGVSWLSIWLCLPVYRTRHGLRPGVLRVWQPPEASGRVLTDVPLGGRGARANRRRAAAGSRTVFSLLDLGACGGGMLPPLAPGFSTVECRSGWDGRDVLCRQSSCCFSYPS